jgi:hypothetical protein
MKARIYVVPCDFVGTRVYRRAGDNEMRGERFFEHWSRVMRRAGELKRLIPGDSNFFLVATHDLIQSLQLPSKLSWTNQQDVVVNSEIAFLNRDTPVRFGSLVAASVRTDPMAA